MSPWERLLEKPHTRGHFVQVCQPGEKSLLTNVALYFSEGLKRGEGALAIVTPLHQEVFIRELGRSGVDTASAIRENG